MATTRLARDTFLVHGHREEVDGLLPVNAMVIRGAEPVLVDTGAAQDRSHLLVAVFELVDPDDLRWVFLSHDDVDHAGNLAAVLDAAPNAVALLDGASGPQHAATIGVPPGRYRCIGDGDRFDAGDRRLLAIRPPVFDAADTRGLFDPTTGVYWSAGAFATTVPHPVEDVAELDADDWAAAMTVEHGRVAPWLGLVDQRRFEATVDRVDGLGAGVIAGAHPGDPRRRRPRRARHHP